MILLERAQKVNTLSHDLLRSGNQPESRSDSRSDSFPVCEKLRRNFEETPANLLPSNGPRDPNKAVDLHSLPAPYRQLKSGDLLTDVLPMSYWCLAGRCLDDALLPQWLTCRCLTTPVTYWLMLPDVLLMSYWRTSSRSFTQTLAIKTKMRIFFFGLSSSRTLFAGRPAASRFNSFEVFPNFTLKRQLEDLLLFY